jgi:soluble lytic murein transglycosylase-like protein
LPPAPADRYDSLFAVYAAWDRQRGAAWIPRTPPLDWRLLKRQAQAESDLNPDALSPVGAQGLVQSMQRTFDEWVKREFGGEPPPTVT